MKYFPLFACALLLASFARATDGVDARSVREKANASDDELVDKMTLYFRDALNGRALPDADVSFQGESRKTDEDGKASFAFPETPDDADARLYADVSKSGYMPTKIALNFKAGGNLFDHHYSISPVMPRGHIRIVLDWGTTPKDLDAHLVKTGAYHLSFRNSKRAKEEAELDRDAENGDGPETITINKLDPEGKYVYYVHDFSDRGTKDTPKLAQSHAHVTVFSDGPMRTFEIPYLAQGPYWTVFFFRNGEIVPAGAVGKKPLEEPASERDPQP